MIIVKNLTKVFKSINLQECVALDNVSFKLPEKGFVFVVGKSGSGKTTLLNLLGALDSPTSGSITVDDETIENLNTKQLANYRNSKVGFIFQDYNLLDSLNVFENVNLSLKLQRKKDKNKILQVLKNVDLEGYEKRYPKELSGGEKQRVAIARSIVKNPSIILADEPTGNLDENTSIQIMDLLKKLSKQHLILIVSHDILLARKYADKIIRLKDGKIVNELERNEEYTKEIILKDDELFIPLHKELSESDSKIIDEILSHNKIKNIRQVDDLFVEKETKDKTKAVIKHSSKHHLSFWSNINLGFIFLKKHGVLMSLFSLLLTILALVSSLTELITTYNYKDVITQELIDCDRDSLYFLRSQYKFYDKYSPEWFTLPCDENAKNQIVESGYKGNIYDCVETVLPCGDHSLKNSHYLKALNPCEYWSTTTGTLICDEDFLLKQFNATKLDFIATNKEVPQEKYGAYLCDYMADALLYNKKNKYKNYDDILGAVSGSNGYNCFYVNKIINTHYKEKHSKAIELLKDNNKLSTKLAQNKYVMSYVNDIRNVYSLTYSTCQDYYNEYLNSPINLDFYSSAFHAINPLNKQDLKVDSGYFNSTKLYNSGLKEDEIIMPYTIYNTLFNKNYTEDNCLTYEGAEKIKFIYNKRIDTDKYENVERTYTIKRLGLYDNYFFFALDPFIDLSKMFCFNNGFVIDNVKEAPKVFETLIEDNYLPMLATVHPAISMTDIILSFSSIFYLLFAILCLCMIALLVFVNVKTIREKMKEIGIIKALGGTNSDILFIFSLQQIVMTLLIILFYTILLFPFMYLANKLVVFSVVKFTVSALLLKTTSLLIFKPIYYIYNILTIICISLISIIFPLLKLHKIKPVEIIKAKE